MKINNNVVYGGSARPGNFCRVETNVAMRSVSSLASVVQGRDKKGMTKVCNTLLSLPMRVLEGLWAGFKYLVYYVSCCKLCKPGPSWEAIKTALGEWKDAKDKQAGFEKFHETCPGGLKHVIDALLATARDAQLGPDRNDPKKVAAWNKEHVDDYKEYEKKFKEGKDFLIDQAHEYAIGRINKK